MGISSESFSNMSLDDRKIIIGIDFGTTFSGVAWAETRKPDQQFVIESWPATSGSRDGASSVKVPTELRYSPQFEWGFQIPPIVERNQWFKLGLAGKPSGHALSEKQRGAEELTADYLTALCEHLTYTLEQKLGSGILRTIEREYVLTVPAIWSEIAKEKTLKACQQAGLSSKSEILLVSEPEAAATYTLNQLDPHGLKIGDTFVLCDAGGGTVDLISYTIIELYPILKVKEAAAGTGGLCGSTFLNRRFGEYLTSKLGQLPGWDSEILAEAMERFDSVIKKHYSPATSATEGYSILVPGLANNEAVGVRRGRLNMKSSDMKEIFDPVIGKVIDLVKGQIEATKEKVRAVLLVGGFGQNGYLKERLRSSIGSSIEVLQPVNAWTAVVRGSVMMGLARANSKLATVGVVSRAARKHYGIKLKVDFDPNIHRQDLKFWDEKHCRHRVTAMRWFIKKGDAVEENRTHEIRFLDHMAVSDGLPKCNSVRVYADEQSPVAPVHQNDNVAALVKLQADLSHLTASELAETIKTLADGKQYYCISAAVEATYYSAYTKYVLLYRGKRYDTVTAEYV